MMQLSVVVPCYNEEAVLPETARQLLQVVSKLIVGGVIDVQSEILFVDDGSGDRTWSVIERLAAVHSNVRGIKLSRNHGHQNALLAGLASARGDAVISIDADLQDDVGVIADMVEAYRNGSEIVYGIRDNRDADTPFKRLTAEGYYRLLRVMGVKVVFNHADFRLISRRALAALAEYGEVNLFLRGIIPMLGFKSSAVYYRRSGRFAGESKYPLSKMLGLAVNGITSFSATPLRTITLVGIVLCMASILAGIWALTVRLVTDYAVPGWTSTVVPSFLLSGVQLLSIGVIGEYLAKIYLEVKRRPRFHIESDTDMSGVRNLSDTRHERVGSELPSAGLQGVCEFFDTSAVSGSLTSSAVPAAQDVRPLV